MEVKVVLHNTVGKSNKIWGIIRESENVCFSFWGRAGKKLSFQEFPTWSWEQQVTVESKEKKGYNEITTDRLNELQPDFDEQVFIMTLSDGFKAKVGYSKLKSVDDE